MNDRNRKYFDYDLAYKMYKQVESLFKKGGLKAVGEVFIIDDTCKDNGYIIVKDEYNAFNSQVYLSNIWFDTDKEEEFYVSGEVDMNSYGGRGADDNLYINDIQHIEDRISHLLDYAKENDYTIEDYEKELESLEKVLEKITIKDDDLLF